MAKTVRFYTLGCKVNQYDTEAMLERFLEVGYSPAKPGAPADVYVVNTLYGHGDGREKEHAGGKAVHKAKPAGRADHRGMPGAKDGGSPARYGRAAGIGYAVPRQNHRAV